MPNWTQEIEARLASLRLAAGREAEIVEELAEHLEQRYAELRGEGLDEAAALALVREELRDNPDLTERMRPLRQANVRRPSPWARRAGSCSRICGRICASRRACCASRKR